MKQGRKVSFCLTDGHLSFEECRIGDKAPKNKGRVAFRGDFVKDNSGSYAVFTKQGSSASQMTAAKVKDLTQYLFLPSFKMEGAPKLLKIPKIGMSRHLGHLDSSTTTQNDPNHGPAWKT